MKNFNFNQLYLKITIQNCDEYELGQNIDVVAFLDFQKFNHQNEGFT